MKRLSLVSVALVLGLGISQVSGQETSGISKPQIEGVRGGIKIDANLSNFILSDLDGTDSNMGFGLSVGGYTKIRMSEIFSLQPEILLHWKNSEMEVKTPKSATDFQYFGVELPVYAVGHFGNAFIGVGPYVGFGIDARYKASGMSDVELYKEYGGQKSGMQRWDFGIGAMFGYEFISRLQINATYKIGFINALNANKDNASMLNSAISLGLGYRF